jgi:hypothetical protein
LGKTRGEETNALLQRPTPSFPTPWDCPKLHGTLSSSVYTSYMAIYG